ncbi:hypothetical protein Bpfe_017882 [Biomphalaria pfeifferi]|uniref:Uncharacterized protein n=1 Tax=Biomphalaria pfeifferi TaxID=112525 RepID=A0AAD8BDY4_BIOPF|nr:hypothetical protein Bpfe_017882 [Biomphalaria pfeifferi]
MQLLRKEWRHKEMKDLIKTNVTYRTVEREDQPTSKWEGLWRKPNSSRKRTVWANIFYQQSRGTLAEWK